MTDNPAADRFNEIAETRNLDEVMQRDPKQVSDDDLAYLVENLRQRRAQFIAKEKKEKKDGS